MGKKKRLLRERMIPQHRTVHWFHSVLPPVSWTKAPVTLTDPQHRVPQRPQSEPGWRDVCSRWPTNHQSAADLTRGSKDQWLRAVTAGTPAWSIGVSILLPAKRDIRLNHPPPAHWESSHEAQRGEAGRGVLGGGGFSRERGRRVVRRKEIRKSSDLQGWKMKPHKLQFL